LLDGMKIMEGAATDEAQMSLFALLIGFIAAFVAGCLACKWMINIVKKGKLVYFAIYCAIIGAITVICSI
jgi:undecaprenyl-diphosphatase